MAFEELDSDGPGDDGAAQPLIVGRPSAPSGMRTISTECDEPNHGQNGHRHEHEHPARRLLLRGGHGARMLDLAPAARRT